MGRQRLSQKCLLPTPLQNPNGRLDNSFSFAQISFGQHSPRPRLIDLRDGPHVIKFIKKPASSIEMLMRVLVSSEGVIKKA